MQYFQPQPGPFPPFNSYGHPGFLQAPPPLPYVNGHPEIIGEGNLTTLVCPDGGTWLVFLPTLQWRYQLPHPQYPSMSNSNVNSLGAWFVRNYCNPIQPNLFYQPRQDYCGTFCTRTKSDCAVNFLSNPLPQLELPLKFHNENSTSTSDLQYFIPKQFSWIHESTSSKGVQIEVPVRNAACHYEIFTDYTTNPEDERYKAQDHECTCSKYIKNIMSHMSVDFKESDRKLPKSERSKSKKSNTYECPESQVDKAVTTCTDQAIGCDDKVRETQTDDRSNSFGREASDYRSKSKKKSKKVQSWDSMISSRSETTSDSDCTCASHN